MSLKKRDPQKAPAHAAQPAQAEPERSGPAHAKPAKRRGPSRLVISLVVTALAAAVVLALTIIRDVTEGPDAGQAASSAQPASTTEEAEATLEDDPVQVEFVEGTTESGIAYTGNSTIADSEALAALEAVVEEYAQAGYTLSIVMRDLDGAEPVSLTYHPDERVYSASALKGPYIVFVYQVLVPTGVLSAGSVSGTAEACIRYSDNDAYRDIRSWTMNQGWSAWMRDAGVDMDDERAWYVDNHWYAETSAEDFARMWTHAYGFLTSQDPNAPWLADLFSDTANSPMHAVLGDAYIVWSKAGWYDTWDGNASPATNDAGIVMSDTGPYVLAICTDAPANFDLLIRAVDAVNRCHGELAGGSTESLVTSATPELHM